MANRAAILTRVLVKVGALNAGGSEASIGSVSEALKEPIRDVERALAALEMRGMIVGQGRAYALTKYGRDALLR